MEKRDIVIAGGGVSGLYLAGLLERAGMDYLLLEKRESVGRYGNRIINNDVFRRIGLEESKSLKPIDKIRFYSPSGHSVGIKSREKRGHVVNLRDVELSLLRRINNKDNIKLGASITEANIGNGTLRTKDREYSSRVIVNASGLAQNIFSQGMKSNDSSVVLCYGLEVEADDCITVSLDREIASGFYGWIIPTGNGTIELGFGTDRRDGLDSVKLKEMLFSLPRIKEYRGSNVRRAMSGLIPREPVKNKCGRNWILVGDSAGGEPVLGASINKCITEARLAFESIKDYLDGSAGSLGVYENRWKKVLGDDIANQNESRSLLDGAKRSQIDDAISNLKGKEIQGEGLINGLFVNIIKEIINSKGR